MNILPVKENVFVRGGEEKRNGSSDRFQGKDPEQVTYFKMGGRGKRPPSRNTKGVMKREKRSSSFFGTAQQHREQSEPATCSGTRARKEKGLQKKILYVRHRVAFSSAKKERLLPAPYIRSSRQRGEEQSGTQRELRPAAYRRNTAAFGKN